MLKETEHPYIATDDEILSGEPIIKSTRTPVRAIVEIWRMGVAVEEIPNQLSHLTMAQRTNRIPDDLIDLRIRNL